LKKLLIICALFLAACQTDLVIPCNHVEGLAGRVCREFVEVDESPVGTVEYEYDTLNRVRVRAFRNNDNSTQKTLTYEYAESSISAVYESVGNTERRTAFGYDTQDSLISVAYFSVGQIDSILFIDRIAGKRIAERLEVWDTLVYFQEYRYRQSDGILDRISFYASDSVLRFYHRIEFFQDGSERIEKRSKDHLLEEQTVIRRNEAGQITLIEVKNPQAEPISSTSFLYDAEGNITCSEVSQIANFRKTTYLYY
jgi:hypothetical protein